MKAVMDATRTRLPTYVSILGSGDDGTVWLHVQLPTGALLRGPYHGPEDTQPAATALERVARRRWAQDKPEPGHIGARIGQPTPQARMTADRGKESREEAYRSGEHFPFPRIFADFLGKWT